MASELWDPLDPMDLQPKLEAIIHDYVTKIRPDIAIKDVKVICDRSNNTEESIAAGKLIVEIISPEPIEGIHGISS